MNYTWESEWIWNYESIWGSIEKFKYANVVTNKELHSILNNKRYRKREIVYTSFYATNNFVDKDELIRILNKDVFKSCEIDLNRLLGSLYNNTDLEKYMEVTLHYCPACIEMGYHSIAHQLSFLDTCIFHNIPLIHQCPQCNKETSYSIDFKNNDSAFTCSCGYRYINESNVFSLWRQSDYMLEYGDNLDKYIIKSKNNQNMILSFNWYYNKSLEKTKKNYDRSKEIYRIVTDRNKKRHNTYNYKPDLKGYAIPSIKHGTNDTALEIYINIMKSISRHIRTSKLQGLNIESYTDQNIYYLESFYYKYPKEQLKFKDININLYAYIMWRKYSEGHESVRTIHKLLIVDDRVPRDYELKNNIKSSIFFKYLTFEISNYIIECKNNEKYALEDYGILISTLEKIIGYILINTYNRWIEYAEEMKKNNGDSIVTFEESIPFIYPDFLLEWNKDQGLGTLQIIE